MRLTITSAILAVSVMAAPALYAGNDFGPGYGNSHGQLPETNIWGLPVSKPIGTSTPVRLLTPNEVLPGPGHERDIVEIVQLQGLYEFYHDGHNGPGVASLFTSDGIFELPLNDGEGHLSPTGGTGGGGCAAYGPTQVAFFFNAGGGVAPLPWTALGHHVMTSPVVSFSEDGNFATLIANYVDDKKSGTPLATTFGNQGEYINDFVRTNSGWRFVHLRALEDQPTTGVNCTLAGQGPK
jgi:hypothetical protein